MATICILGTFFKVSKMSETLPPAGTAVLCQEGGSGVEEQPGERTEREPGNHYIIT